MTDSLVAAAIGLGAGILSGAFGVGGGVVTMPAIRMLLGYPELIAIGTPLPVILPTAVAGALMHLRQGTAELRTGLTVGLWGVPFAVAGAFLTRAVGGTIVLVIASAVIVIIAIDMMRARRSEAEVETPVPTRGPVRTALVGMTTGLYSGFLGLGGGFILVPMLYRLFGFPMKRAAGTSLIAVAVFAVPGSVTHWTLGHVDIPLALALIVGVIPGAVLGARIAYVSGDRVLRLTFSALLAFAGATMGLSEAGIL